MYNFWNIIAVFFVCTGLALLVTVSVSLLKNRQPIKIMRATWFFTMLWATFLGWWAYKKIGINGINGMKYSSPYSWPHIALSTLQTGAACTIGILIAQIVEMFLPLSIEGNVRIGTTLSEIILSLLMGIILQYRMFRQRGVHNPILATDRAMRAEVMPVMAWMGGFFFWWWVVNDLCPNFLQAHKHDWIYWFVLQIGMYFGFFFSFPVNYLLVRKGVKKRM